MKVIKMLINMMAVICYIVIGCVVLLVAPMITGNKPMIVLSGSMEPTYHVGSLIYMKETPFSDLEVGDVITYGKDEDGLVTHRIVEISQLSGTLVTRGDANDVNDAEIDASEVRGRINSTLNIPYAGYVLQTIREPAVMIGIAVILVVKILLDTLIKDEGSKMGNTPSKHR